MPSGKFRPDPTMCRNGRHVLAEVGTWSDGRCAGCAREWQNENKVDKRPRQVTGLGSGWWRPDPERCRSGKHLLAEVGRAPDGHCKGCLKEWRQANWIKNREKFLAEKKQRWRENYVPHPKPELTHCVNGHEFAVTGRHNDGHCAECRRLRDQRRIGGRPRWDINEYARDFAAQDGKCAICRQPETRRSNNGKGEICRLTRDHDHKTGMQRGLICHRCNVVLGMVGDDVHRLEKLANYLELLQKKKLVASLN